MDVDLVGEFVASVKALQDNSKQMAWLRAQGLVPGLDAVPGLGSARIVASDDPGALWRFAVPGETGLGVLIVPVFVSAMSVDAWGAPDARAPDIVDLVAVHPREPDRWWRRLGNATWLGEWAVDAARHDGGELRLHADPLAWLRAGGAGAVLLALAEGEYLRDHVWGIRRLVCADEGHAEMIAKLLRKRAPAMPLPKVAYAMAAGAAAGGAA